MDRSAVIRALNDNFRTTFSGGVVLITPGVQALSPDVKAVLLERVRKFDRFTTENDPHGEHDFGTMCIFQQEFFWKIDYLDEGMGFASEDPADPKKTTRTITIMKAEEY